MVSSEDFSRASDIVNSSNSDLEEQVKENSPFVKAVNIIASNSDKVSFVAKKIMDFYNSSDNQEELEEKIIKISDWCKDVDSSINGENKSIFASNYKYQLDTKVMKFFENDEPLNMSVIDKMISSINEFDLVKNFTASLYEGNTGNAYMSEKLTSGNGEDENDKSVAPILSYVLDNILQDEKDDVKVVPDNSLESENYDFYGDKLKISDNSQIKYKSDKEKFDTKIVGNSQENSMTISHSKNINSPEFAVMSALNGMVDFMSAKQQLPFDFNINTKTETFLKTLFDSIRKLQNIEMFQNNVSQNAMVNSVKTDDIKNKISSFVIDGVNIPYDNMQKFVNFKEFSDFISVMKIQKTDEGNSDNKKVEPGIISDVLSNAR